MNLKDQAVKSVMWTTLRTICVSLCGPILIFIQARYLTPTEFGVLAIINIIYGILNVLENFGFSQAVIQKDEVSKNERSSLFFFEIFFCLSITAVLIITAPIAAVIFDMPILTRLLSLLSIVVLLNGPMLLFTAFLEKEFHFKELSIIQIIREVSIVIITFILLYLDYGLTGIVIGKISAVAIMVTLVGAVAFKYDLLHIGFHFKFSEIIPFIQFGVFVSLKQILTHITHHIDEMIIGYYLSAEILGLYHFAKNMLGRLRTLITTSFSKVLFPILSKVKNDRPRLTSAYNNISKYIGIFGFPIFLGIAVTAHLFVPLIFGGEWEGSVPFFQILAITFIPYILTANLSTSLLYSVGKPNLVLYIDLVLNTIYIGLLIIFSMNNLGIFAITYLYSAYIIIKTVILQFMTSKYLHYKFRNYLLLFKNIIWTSCFMVSGVLIVQYLLQDSNVVWFQFLISLVIGIIIYIVTFYLFDKKALLEIRNLINSKKSKV